MMHTRSAASHPSPIKTNYCQTHVVWQPTLLDDANPFTQPHKRTSTDMPVLLLFSTVCCYYAAKAHRLSSLSCNKPAAQLFLLPPASLLPPSPPTNQQQPWVCVAPLRKQERGRVAHASGPTRPQGTCCLKREAVHPRTTLSQSGLEARTSLTGDTAADKTGAALATTRPAPPPSPPPPPAHPWHPASCTVPVCGQISNDRQQQQSTQDSKTHLLRELYCLLRF